MVNVTDFLFFLAVGLGLFAMGVATGKTVQIPSTSISAATDICPTGLFSIAPNGQYRCNSGLEGKLNK